MYGCFTMTPEEQERRCCYPRFPPTPSAESRAMSVDDCAESVSNTLDQPRLACQDGFLLKSHTIKLGSPTAPLFGTLRMPPPSS